ncbi:MAG: HesA/MoeB/ThiF family protein [Acidobacteria bacterium]|nr:MAG: HesA/MoeB/ThiF family protein [Acidobacteriota bacterium]MCE7956883.1 HesA/MoeB/ThiF family protein [Acidobacteria bacterium ACB2]
MAPSRHDRQLAIPGLGEAGQARLAASRLVVLGAGGLGFPVLSYLGAAGVGRITVVERDEVELTNLNRQLLFTERDLGRRKADAARERLTALDPSLDWRVLDGSLDLELASGLCREADLAVDCADNGASRRTLAAAALAAGIPLVHGAVAAFEGTVCVFGPRGRPCLACLYPEDPAASPAPPPVLGAAVGVVGSLMATEAIRLLSGIGPPRFGELLLVDLERRAFDRVPLEPRPGCALCGDG